MNETIASDRKDANVYVKYLISTAWKNINEERDLTFFEIVMNLARMSYCMYQHREEFGVADHKTKNNMLTVVITYSAHSPHQNVSTKFK